MRALSSKIAGPRSHGDLSTCEVMCWCMSRGSRPGESDDYSQDGNDGRVGISWPEARFMAGS